MINSFQMIAVSPTHEAPKEQFYDFNSARFFMDEKIVKLLNATHSNAVAASAGGSAQGK